MKYSCNINDLGSNPKDRKPLSRRKRLKDFCPGRVMVLNLWQETHCKVKRILGIRI